MTFDRRAQALVALVQEHRDASREAILREACERARALLAQAHAEARARLRTALEEERRTGAERVAAARARMQTRRRLADQQRMRVLLRKAWDALPDALRALWRDPAGRGAWVDSTVRLAQRAIGAGQWQIEHAADWPAHERDAMADVLRAHGIEVRYTAREDIDAGLRLLCGGNTVEATVAGLLADRDDVSARLLLALGELA